MVYYQSWDIIFRRRNTVSVGILNVSRCETVLHPLPLFWGERVFFPSHAPLIFHISTLPQDLAWACSTNKDFIHYFKLSENPLWGVFMLLSILTLIFKKCLQNSTHRGISCILGLGLSWMIHENYELKYSPD